MIDIHTHIIFDVDDGSNTLEESIAILKSAESAGVTDIICTPHYIEPCNYDSKRVIGNFNILKKESEKINIKLHLGNEIAIYGNIVDILERKNKNTLANSKYILIEFPMSTDVKYVLNTIYEIKINNMIPIIAHPERTECFRKDIQLIRQAVEEGALVQCNTQSVLGTYGHTAKKIVKKLLKEHLVHFMSTDEHRFENKRYNNLLKVEKKVEKIVGKLEKNKLFSMNAKQILLNENLQ